MGRQDGEHKLYFADKRRYADLWNGGLFHGKQLIKADELQDVDTVQTMADQKGILEQTRDLVMKQVRGGQALAVWVLENQQTVDYTMPARVMLQEAMEYHRQIRVIKKQNESEYRRQKDQGTSAENRRTGDKQGVKKQEKFFRDDGEFLYKFREQDRLLPVATLVAYWGEEWKGPKTLYDLIDFGEDEVLGKELRKLVPEYPLHFVNLSSLEDYGVFQTELRILLELYACRNDKERFQDYINSHEECRHMDEETLHMLSVMTHSKELQGLGIKAKEENVNMCKAITDLILDGKIEGKMEGKAEGKAEIIVGAVRKMLDRGLEGKEMAELLGQTPGYIEGVVQLFDANPEAEDEEIAQLLVER